MRNLMGHSSGTSGSRYIILRCTLAAQCSADAFPNRRRCSFPTWSLWPPIKAPTLLPGDRSPAQRSATRSQSFQKELTVGGIVLGPWLPTAHDNVAWQIPEAHSLA